MEERRKSPLSEEQRQALVETIVQAIRSEIAGLAVPQEVHRQHHEFLALLLEDRKRRLDRNEKIKTSVLGWVVISILGGIGTLAYQWFTTLKEHLK